MANHSQSPINSGEPKQYPYHTAEPTGFVLHIDGDKSEKLSNWTAKIIAEVRDHDGFVSRYDGVASLNSKDVRFSATPHQLDQLDFVQNRLGLQASICSKPGTRQRIVDAIKANSTEVTSIVQVEKIGFHDIEDATGKSCKVFVHAGGIIAPNGFEREVVLNPSANLHEFRLPEPSTNKKATAAELLGLSKATNIHVAKALLAYKVYALTTDPSVAIALTGPSGAGKSTVGSLLASTNGFGFDGQTCPDSWSSTQKAIETRLRSVLNTVVTVDDAVNDAAGKRNGIKAKVDAVVRSNTNQQAAQRLNPTGKASKLDGRQGGMVITCESISETGSIKARMNVLRLEREDVDWDRVTAFQKKVSTGTYAQAWADLIHWLGQEPSWQSEIEQKRVSFATLWRGRLKDGHARLAENIAALQSGHHTLIQYCEDVGALSSTEVDSSLAEFETQLQEIADYQIELANPTSSAKPFMEFIQDSLDAGESRIEMIVKRGKNGVERKTYGSPYGKCIGYFDEKLGTVYLVPDEARTAAMKSANASGEEFDISSKVLGKWLKQAGLLKHRDADRNTYKVVIGGKRIRVYAIEAKHLKLDCVTKKSVRKSKPRVKPNMSLKHYDLATLAHGKGGIAWTEDTINPVVGCKAKSTECRSCWAKQLHDRRHADYHRFEADADGTWNPIAVQYAKPFSEIQLLQSRINSLKAGKKQRLVFVNSTSDTFHESVPNDYIHEILKAIEEAPQSVFILLTKRPERFNSIRKPGTWPKNVILAVTVGCRSSLDRVKLLVDAKPTTAMLSIEPLVEELCGPTKQQGGLSVYARKGLDLNGIDWAVVGGEAGGKDIAERLRPMNPSWACNIRDLCKTSGTAFMFKQHGCPIHETQIPKGRVVADDAHVYELEDGSKAYFMDKSVTGRLLDGELYDEFPVIKRIDISTEDTETGGCHES